jgi:hypothetical protein
MEALKGAFFFPLPGQQSIQNTCRASQFTSPTPCQLEILEELGEVFPNLDGISQRGSFPVPGQQLSKMHVEHDHSPTPPSSVGKLERIRGGFSQCWQVLGS